MDWTSCCLCLPGRSWIVSAKQRAAERRQTEERREVLINAAQPGMEEGDGEVQSRNVRGTGLKEEKSFVLLATEQRREKKNCVARIKCWHWTFLQTTDTWYLYVSYVQYHTNICEAMYLTLDVYESSSRGGDDGSGVITRADRGQAPDHCSRLTVQPYLLWQMQIFFIWTCRDKGGYFLRCDRVCGDRSVYFLMRHLNFSMFVPTIPGILSQNMIFSYSHTK